MAYVYGFLFFCLGAVLASFVGVLTGRRATGESIVRGRSRCDACGAQLSGRMLVPIVSYVSYGGRAQCCSARIPARSTIAELLLGALFALSYATFGFASSLPFFLASLVMLLALVEYDLAHQILPPSFLAAFATAAALAGFLSAPFASFLSAAAAGAVFAAFFAALHYGSQGRLMGFSDIPLVFALALLSASATVAYAGFVFAFWIGAVIGIIVLLGRPAGSRMGVEVPFAPFLAAGFLLAIFTQWNPLTMVAAVLARLMGV